MQDTGLSYQGPIYFLIIVVFGSFFLLNLILAAIMDSFDKVDKEEVFEEIKKELINAEKKITRHRKSLSNKIGGGEGVD